MTLIISGASGFVGQNIARLCEKRGQPYVALGRDISVVRQTPKAPYQAFVHAAGRAHRKGWASHDEAAFFRDNVDLTRTYLELCVDLGIKHFVYISSVSHLTQNNRSPYARSKRAAEELVRSFCPENGMSYTILRPTLALGLTEKGNFGQILWALRRHIPLPLAGLKNRRSIIRVEVLCDRVLQSALDMRHKNRCYIVCEDRTLSTPDIVRHGGKLLGKKPLLFPFSLPVLSFILNMLGQGTAVRKLLTNLEFNNEFPDFSGSASSNKSLMQ